MRPGLGAPQAVYQAYNAQRKELANQLDNLERKRNDVMSENGRALGAGAAQPIDVAAREKAKVAREADRS